MLRIPWKSALTDERKALNLIKGSEGSTALGGVGGGAHLNALHYGFFTLRHPISPSFGILKHLGLDMNYSPTFTTVNLQHSLYAASTLMVDHFAKRKSGLDIVLCLHIETNLLLLKSSRSGSRS